tara:strand:- start:1886 stop:2422 length:537 start_codon:yes stop_codon:yes gene_type:complete
MISLDNDLTLYPIKLEDQPTLFGLMDEVYNSAYPDFWTDGGEWYLELCYSFENLKKELSADISHYFFVEYQGNKVGILKYDFPFSPTKTEIPHAMKLHRLYLAQSVHGTGIAQQLMQYVEKVAKENELDFIWLEAMTKKPQAKRFYEKMGYAWVLTYQLEFERLHPEVRGIQIMKKKV